jgi:hypothetical protein
VTVRDPWGNAYGDSYETTYGGSWRARDPSEERPTPYRMRMGQPERPLRHRIAGRALDAVIIVVIVTSLATLAEALLA